MTISAAIAQIRDQIRDGFADIKASIASKQTLADGNSELQAQLATVTGQLTEANAQVANLNAKLAEAKGAHEQAIAERDAAAAEVESLKESAKSAEAKAVDIVASIGAAPVKTSADSEAPANLAEELAKAKTGAERAKVFAKYGGASKAFRALRSL